MKLAIILGLAALQGSQINFGTQVKGSAASVKYASDFRWIQSPSDDLSVAGTNTITLSPCPRGFFVNLPDYVPTHYVAIAGTGTPEAVKAARVSGFAGQASCQISVTTQNPHPTGYTVGTASGGIKEASEAARTGIGYNATRGGMVAIDSAGSPFSVRAPLHFEASGQVINYAGGRIECVVSGDDCIVVGQRQSQQTTTGVTLNNLVIHAANGDLANNFDAIHVNAQGTVIRNPYFWYSASSSNGSPIGSFNSYVSVCDDEAFTLDGLQVTNSFGLRTDRRGQAVYALAEGDKRNTNNCFAVGWLHHINGNMQCGGNVIRWLSGNGLSVKNSIVQGFSQFGILTGTPTGGFNGNTVVDDAYFEVGGCSGPTAGNPDYITAGATGAASHAQAGVITQGGTVFGRGSTGFAGGVPTFNCSGTAGTNALTYWAIANQTGAAQGNGQASPLLLGITPATCSGTVTGYIPRIPPATGGTVTYDVLRTCGALGTTVAPYRGGTPGGATCNAGSVVVGQADTGAAVQSFTDSDAAAATSSYTVAQMAFVPYLPFWIGNAVLSAASATNRNSVPVAVLVGDVQISGAEKAGLISVNGPYSPSFYSLFGGTRSGNVLTPGTVSVIGGGAGKAMIMLRAVGAFADSAGTKGPLNFMSTNIGNYSAGSAIITLVDSNPDKTLATPGNRPPMDATDAYIANDNVGNVGNTAVPLAFGDPVSFSWYINSLPDGNSWKARLTGSGFAVVGGSANRTVCWKTDGKTLGFCSTTPDSQGACTCN